MLKKTSNTKQSKKPLLFLRLSSSTQLLLGDAFELLGQPLVLLAFELKVLDSLEVPSLLVHKLQNDERVKSVCIFVLE